MTGPGGPDREPTSSREALQEVSDVARGGTWRQRLRLIWQVVALVVLFAGGIALNHKVDDWVAPLWKRHSDLLTGLLFGGLALAVAFFRPFRRAALAILKLLALIAPSIGFVLLVSKVSDHFLTRAQSDTVTLLVMLPVTVLIFYVLVFAARRPATGKEGPLRRVARWWGGKFPSKVRVGILTTTAAYAREEREKREAQKTERHD